MRKLKEEGRSKEKETGLRESQTSLSKEGRHMTNQLLSIEAIYLRVKHT